MLRPPTAFPEAKALVFPVSRLGVDPERFSDNTQEPMSQVGMGFILKDLWSAAM